MEFVEWLHHELKERGWTYAELARRSELSSAAISYVISEQHRPGPDFCHGMARAFDMPPETVMRKAGLLPHRNTKEAQFEEIEHHYDRMSPERQKILRDIAKSLDKEG